VRKSKAKKLAGNTRALAKEGAVLKKEDKALGHKVLAEKTNVVRSSSGPKSTVKVGPREFDDSELDLFERDFEEVEFDARDFDDDLYLD